MRSHSSSVFVVVVVLFSSWYFASVTHFPFIWKNTIDLDSFFIYKQTFKRCLRRFVENKITQWIQYKLFTISKAQMLHFMDLYLFACFSSPRCTRSIIAWIACWKVLPFFFFFIHTNQVLTKMVRAHRFNYFNDKGGDIFEREKNKKQKHCVYNFSRILFLFIL